jgi:ATP-dependent DNA helicase RecG
MKDACRTATVPEPILRYEPFGLWVEFSFPARTTQETTQEKILAAMQLTPSTTRRQLAELIGLTEDGIKYHLNKLKPNGLIRRVCPTKAGHWEVLR